jgi:hypothetical protein
LEGCVEDELWEARDDIDADYPKGDSGVELIATCEQFIEIAQEWVWEIRDDEAHSLSSERPILGLWMKYLILVAKIGAVLEIRAMFSDVLRIHTRLVELDTESLAALQDLQSAEYLANRAFSNWFDIHYDETYLNYVNTWIRMYRSLRSRMELCDFFVQSLLAISKKGRYTLLQNTSTHIANTVIGLTHHHNAY